VVATGAYERAWPVPGWELPGVMTTGAAQTMWRTARRLPGQRVLIAGNGPLNLQLAAELRGGGAEVVAVVEAAGPAMRAPAALAAAVSESESAAPAAVYPEVLAHQSADGWLGPDDGFGGKGDDYWSAWNVVAALLQYADAKRGTPIAARCMDSVLAHIAEASRRMKTTPLIPGGWSQNRWQDWVYLCEWTTDMGVTEAQRRMLYEASQLAFGQRWDWQR
jgi:hypothetical protein